MSALWTFKTIGPTAPESFNHEIINPAAFTIKTDFDQIRFQSICKAVTTRFLDYATERLRVQIDMSIRVIKIDSALITVHVNAGHEIILFELRHLVLPDLQIRMPS
jgi:hypothetical protein